MIEFRAWLVAWVNEAVTSDDNRTRQAVLDQFDKATGFHPDCPQYDPTKDPAWIGNVIAKLCACQRDGLTHVFAHNDDGRIEMVSDVGGYRSTFNDGKAHGVTIKAEHSPGTRRHWRP